MQPPFLKTKKQKGPDPISCTISSFQKIQQLRRLPYVCSIDRTRIRLAPAPIAPCQSPPDTSTFVAPIFLHTGVFSADPHSRPIRSAKQKIHLFKLISKEKLCQPNPSIHIPGKQERKNYPPSGKGGGEG
jgi:hypothetical protein